MQSNQNISEQTNEFITIPDLVEAIKTNGWKLENEKPYLYILIKGDRRIVISKEETEWRLVCRDNFHHGETLALPCISKINPVPLMAVLKAYGIVSLMFLAEACGVNLHDVLGLEGVVS